MLKYKLAFGPMSKESIEAVYRYSCFKDCPLMLICSRNQIDHDSGYVFKTSEYSDYLSEMKSKYAKSNVRICRDHCGPGFSENGNSIDGVKETIRQDINNGFNLIHIDLCHYNADRKERVEESARLIEYAQSLSPDIMFEIGTDENDLEAETDHERISQEIRFFKNVCDVEFYVIKTGSLVMLNKNVGSFKPDIIKQSVDAVHSEGVKVKEHNADYLSREEIKKRSGIVDAMNIAPQLGVFQTGHLLNQCLIYGIDVSDFISLCYDSNKWKKWVFNKSNYDPYFLANICGHYHFRSEKYKKIVLELNNVSDNKESSICYLMNIIDHYARSFE